MPTVHRNLGADGGCLVKLPRLAVMVYCKLAEKLLQICRQAKSLGEGCGIPLLLQPCTKGIYDSALKSSGYAQNFSCEKEHNANQRKQRKRKSSGSSPLSIRVSKLELAKSSSALYNKTFRNIISSTSSSA